MDAYGSGPDPAWLHVDWREHQRWVTVAERPVNVVDLGPRDAPVLLFVHGHSACWQHWLEQLVGPDGFAEHFRCVAVDLPGFGRSPMPDGPVSIEAYGRTLDAVCDALDITAACVVGNSLGGFVAAELAISFPARVERLVLVAAAGLAGKYIGLPTAFIRHPGAVRAGQVLFGLGGVPDAMSRALARRARGRKATLGFVVTRADELHPALVHELVHGGTGRPAAAPAAVDLATYDFRARVPEIACPTLIVWGDRDYLVPVSCSGEYEQAIPDARRVVYEQTGHLPMIERPARFNADLRAFLREEPPGVDSAPSRAAAA